MLFDIKPEVNLIYNENVNLVFTKISNSEKALKNLLNCKE